MAKANAKRLNQNDWLKGALKILRKSGIDSVKIVPLAKSLGVTTGSFYWHFADRPALYDALLDYWEKEMTDKAIAAARAFEGSPEERIWRLMEQVMDTGMAQYDLAIWHWAQSNKKVKEVFRRTVEKRFSFAAWMFEQAGFDQVQAKMRGRMMVVYMMGESTLVSENKTDRKEFLRLKHEILTTA